MSVFLAERPKSALSEDFSAEYWSEELSVRLQSARQNYLNYSLDPSVKKSSKEQH
jgi:hypothetical protein